MDLKNNIALLLLQIIFYRQQELCHLDKSLDSDTLMTDPIIDDAILHKFRNHKLVELHAADLSGIRLRILKNLVKELFEKGLPDDEGPVNVVSLANFYYSQRIRELESEELPKIRNELIRDLHDAQ
ncbi:LAFE_0E07624g1_1 [Lachancea fermentati]|uniref:LAFE_0E07624g1_1 n=1 Tax=Lachancea fermentati TaxID=4955 RepID=A0A1G4MDE8_LACFM|nr:LAFE_0E07624g1_1 [Lachancea fermentati]